MQMKMTSRDKFLLTVMAFLLIGVGFIYYLIMPTLGRMDDLDLEISDAQIKEQEMKLKISMYPDYEQNLENMKQTAANETAQYYNLLTSQEVDRELTNIVLAYGLESVGLNISPAVYTSSEPYSRSMLARMDELQEMAAAAAEDTQDDAQEEPAYPTRVDGVQDQIYTCAVKLTVRGAEEDYQKMIDAFVNEYPAIRVTSISYQKEAARTVTRVNGETLVREGSRELVLGLEMYMCDKRLYGEVQPQESVSSQDALNQAMSVLSSLQQIMGAQAGQPAE